ncbi:MAG: cupin domain-containing protein [Treponemataceae bacterium]
MFSIHSEKNYAEILAGIKIKTLVHGDSTLMSEFQLKKGSALPAHTHPYEQTGYLVSGKLDLHIGADHQVLLPGASWCVHSNIEHRAEVLEDSVAIEVFSPKREDYIKFLDLEAVR